MLILSFQNVFAEMLPTYHETEFRIDRETSDFLIGYTNVVMIKTDKDTTTFQNSCYHAEWTKPIITCTFVSVKELDLHEKVTVYFSVYENVNPKKVDWVECHEYGSMNAYCAPAKEKIVELDGLKPILTQSVEVETDRDTRKSFSVILKKDEIRIEPYEENMEKKEFNIFNFLGKLLDGILASIARLFSWG